MSRNTLRLTVFLMMGIFALVSQEIGVAQENGWVISHASGEVLTGCSLDSLVGNSLWIHQTDAPVSLPLDSVLLMRLPERSHGMTGLLVGVAVGGTLGALIAPGPSTEHHTITFIGTWEYDEQVASRKPVGAFLGACLGGALGYMAGSSNGEERSFDFRGESRQVKKEAVWNILQGGIWYGN